MSKESTPLAEFLLARLREDESVARDWAHHGSRKVEVHGGGAGYLALVTPNRVLAEVEAKRRIVEFITSERHQVLEEDCWYTCAAATEERDGGDTCDDTRRGGNCDCGRDARVARRLSIIAAIYSDHPDYVEARMRT